MSEDFDSNNWSTDDLHGDSVQVLDDAFVLNPGAALTQDIANAGSYPLHIETGAEVWADKNEKGEVSVRVHVMPWRWTEYRKKLQEMKDQWKGVTGPTKPWYHLEGFVTAVLAAKFDVHPQWDEEAFERVLWREIPEAWISPEFAPRIH